MKIGDLFGGEARRLGGNLEDDRRGIRVGLDIQLGKCHEPAADEDQQAQQDDRAPGKPEYKYRLQHGSPLPSFLTLGRAAVSWGARDRQHVAQEERAIRGNQLAYLQALEDLPVTFVAGRNLIFITYAAALAYRRSIRNIVTGVAQTDYSGYPDCREETIDALQRAIQLGMEYKFVIHTPLMHRSKKETVELAIELGALEVMALTHTCYNGVRPPCGQCAACELRAKGFSEAGVPDPLLQSR